jgi:hypothetical protein
VYDGKRNRVNNGTMLTSFLRSVILPLIRPNVRARTNPDSSEIRTMTAATESNGAQVTPERTIPALRRLITQIDDELDTARDLTQLTVLLDRRKALRGALAELAKEREARKARAQQQFTVEQEPYEPQLRLPTHEELADAVERATAAGEQCATFQGNGDIGPEAKYEVECLERVRRLVFMMGGLVDPGISIAQGDEIDWDSMGPAAVHLDDCVVVAMPLENNEAMPRSCEIRGVLLIPLEKVMPRA